MYSIDIRKRSIKLHTEGVSRTRISSILGIDRKTLYHWIKILKEQGPAALFTDQMKPRERKRTLDLKEFKVFVDCNSGLTIKEMASRLNVTARIVQWSLKTLGYTRKKNNLHSKKETKKTDNYF